IASRRGLLRVGGLAPADVRERVVSRSDQFAARAVGAGPQRTGGRTDEPADGRAGRSLWVATRRSARGRGSRNPGGHGRRQGGADAPPPGTARAARTAPWQGRKSQQETNG